MSENTPTPADIAPVEPAQATPEPAAEPDWKAEARKWESRAKENKGAAERLAEIEEANKTAEQKAAERLAAAEKAASEAEAKVLRRDVALEHKLDPADAALLDNITDEAVLRALAARLAPSNEPGARTPRPDPNQGKSSRVPASTGEQFAAFFTSQVGG